MLKVADDVVTFSTDTMEELKYKDYFLEVM